jgi:NADH dehydrogenase [ubiquinone] 1 alpha subcomplex assembly factor 7
MENPLLPIIRERIDAQGSLSIAEYMELCLSHPDHGYYVKQDPFGVSGDFITAPEICQIFGEMIGVWLGEAWRRMGGGAFSLVELGPGRGTLMADILRATKNIPDFHAAATLHMVETSPVLANAQYMKLRHLHERVEWLDSFEDVPEHAPLLLIANEFFDALPIRQLVQSDDGVRERRIGWNDAEQKLEFKLGPPGLSLAKGDQIIPNGTVMEQCPAARAMMRDIATRIANNDGAALIIDYGYMGDAHRDTLQAVKSHHFHSVLEDPGNADLTAHVDFTSLLHVAQAEGVHTYGTIGQGTFLKNMGADIRLNMLKKEAPPDVAQRLSEGLERLISPQAMGDLFQVMAITQDYVADMPGFDR